MSTFGEPGRNDATSQYERQIQKVAEQHNSWIMEQGPHVLNRPIGSLIIPPEVQLEQYTAIRNDQNALRERYTQLVQQQGPVRGTLAFTRWVKRMEARLNESL